jgi:hypothetical protein
MISMQRLDVLDLERIEVKVIKTEKGERILEADKRSTYSTALVELLRQMGQLNSTDIHIKAQSKCFHEVRPLLHRSRIDRMGRGLYRQNVSSSSTM